MFSEVTQPNAHVWSSPALSAWASRSLARFGGVNYDVGVVVRAFLPQAHFSQAQGAISVLTSVRQKLTIRFGCCKINVQFVLCNWFI